MRTTILACGLLLTLAWLIRPMADLPLWVDEGWSAVAAQQDSIGDELAFIRSDVHPPLYFLMLKIWQNLAGESPFAMRFISMSASLISLTLSYRLARDLFGAKAALATAIIMATSDLLFSLTPEVRHYSLYMLLVILSNWCVWHWQKRWDFKWGLGFGIAAIALMYTLYWGAFILLAAALYLLIYQRRFWRRWLPVFILIGLCYTPWLPSLRAQLQGNDTDAVGAGGYNNALAFDRFAAEVTLFQLFGLPEALFLGLTLAGLVIWEKRIYLAPPSVFLGLWLSFPLVMAFASAAGGYSLLTHRPMLALLPPMAILAGYALSQMPVWVYQILLGIILVNNLTTTGAEPPQRGPWIELGDFMAAYSSPQASLLIESDLNAYAMGWHVELADAPFQAMIRTDQQRAGYAGEPNAPLGDLLANSDSLWLVEYLRRQDLRADLAEWGFTQTTPSLPLEFFILDDVLLTRFARPISISEDAPIFGEELLLAESDYFQWNYSIQVDLTWYPLQNLTEDYTVSVFILGEDGRILDQHDSYPLNGKNPMADWQVNQYYFDRHTLMGEAGQIGVKVYLWQNGTIQILPSDGQEFILLPE